MTGSQLKRVAIALVVAVFLWGLVEIAGRSGDVVEEGTLLPAIEMAQVDTVRFVRDADTIAIARAGDDAWTVNGLAASPKEISALGGALATAVVGSLAARNPESHARMQIDDSSAKRLTVRRGDQILGDLLVGASGRAYQSAYVRRPDADEVYLVEHALVPMLARQINEWRDPRVIVIAADSIGSIEVRRGGARYRLARSVDAWTLNGRATDSTRVARLVDAIATWEVAPTAFATPEQADSADFRRPERELRLLSLSGAEVATVAFDSTDGAFWGRRSGDETVYRLYAWKVNDLTPPDTSLLQRD